MINYNLYNYVMVKPQCDIKVKAKTKIIPNNRPTSTLINIIKQNNLILLTSYFW